MSGQLGELVVSLRADIARFQSDMGKAAKISQDSANQMAGAFASVHANIAKIGTIITTVAAGAGLAKIIDDAANWNLEAAKMAKTMGTTTEQASIMDVALRKTGVSTDIAQAAALRLSKDLTTGTEKFDRYGVSVKDANGNLLPMPTIMANVNAKLLETKTGTERNIVAMDLYGRSWGEIQSILKLTPAAMNEARETAERLHLVVGPEGVAQSLEYKKNLREVELVAKSLSVQMGNELMPAVVSIGSYLGGSGVSAAGMFGAAIKETVRYTQLLTVSLAANIDKMVAWVNTGGVIGHLFSKSANADYQKQVGIINNAAGDQMAEIDRMMDRKPAASKQPSGSTINPAALGRAGRSSAPTETDESQQHVNNAYLAYEKQYNEYMAQIRKSANTLMEQQNQQAYDAGLVDLKTYLDTKYRLNEKNLQDELVAKKEELTAARSAEAETLKQYADPNSKTNSADVSKAYEKTIQAVAAVDAAQRKLTEAKSADAAETKTQLADQQRSFQEIQAQFLDMQGKTVEAETIRTQLAETDQQRLRLKADALRGLAGAQDALNAKEAMEANALALKQNALALKRNEEQTNYLITQKSIAELNGEYNKSRNLEAQLLELEKQRAELTGKIYDIPLIQAQRARLAQSGSPFGAFGQGFSDTTMEWRDTAKQMQDIGKNTAQQMQNDFSNIFFDGMQGKLHSLADYFNEFTKSLEKSLADFLSKQLVSGITGGSTWDLPGDIGGLFGDGFSISGFRASGGDVVGGESYLVGEEGLELFTPGVSGSITPNNQLGGSTFAPVYNIDARNSTLSHGQIQSIVDQSVRQSKNDILNSMNRGGEFAVASGRMSR